MWLIWCGQLGHRKLIEFNGNLSRWKYQEGTSINQPLWPTTQSISTWIFYRSSDWKCLPFATMPQLIYSWPKMQNYSIWSISLLLGYSRPLNLLNLSFDYVYQNLGVSWYIKVHHSDCIQRILLVLWQIEGNHCWNCEKIFIAFKIHF